jgi:hypothetical protein
VSTADAHRDAAAFRDAICDLYLRRNQDEVLPELPGIIPTDVRIDVGENEHLACKQALVERNLNGARRALSSGDDERSAKMTRLQEIIAECRDGQKKVLVFSQFRRSWHSAARSSGRKPWLFTVTCHSASGRRS